MVASHPHSRPGCLMHPRKVCARWLWQLTWQRRRLPLMTARSSSIGAASRNWRLIRRVASPAYVQQWCRRLQHSSGEGVQDGYRLARASGWSHGRSLQGCHNTRHLRCAVCLFRGCACRSRYGHWLSRNCSHRFGTGCDGQGDGRGSCVAGGHNTTTWPCC